MIIFIITNIYTLNYAQSIEEPLYKLVHKDFHPTLTNTVNKPSSGYTGYKDKGKSQVSTDITDNNDNPFERFERIKKEIEYIENDISFYKNNQELFKQKFNYSYESAYEEVSKLKSVTDFMRKSENFSLIKEIIKKDKKFLGPDKNVVSLLNKKNIEENNKNLLKNINLINSIKGNKITDFDKICYELYLTPDTSHIKLYSQIVDIQKMIEDLQEKIGNYDLVSLILKDI
jgi:hypothetical protein